MRAKRCAFGTAMKSVIAALAVANATTARAADGVAVYDRVCVACHQPGGVGVTGLAPPVAAKHLANAATKNPNYAVLVVLNGLSGHLPLADGQEMTGIMPPVGASLTDDEVADVVNYVYGTLNGAKSAIDGKAVAALRAEKPTAKDLRTLREELLK